MKTSEHSYPLFRLCLAGLLKRGSCWLLLVGMLVFVWAIPLLTPWDEHPQILQPARAQAAWIYVWLAMFTWLPFQSAMLGRRLRQEGLLEFLHARNRSGGLFSLNLQIAASLVVWLIALIVLACLICLTVCLPKSSVEATQWFILVMQYGAVAAVSGIPLIFLGVSLGTRAGEVVATLVPVALLFGGLVASTWLAPLLAGSDALLYRLAWIGLPHYHLADLTPRLVFKLGPLMSVTFRDSLLCLLAQGVTLTLLGRCVFRTRV